MDHIQAVIDRSQVTRLVRIAQIEAHLKSAETVKWKAGYVDHLKAELASHQLHSSLYQAAKAAQQ
jgi:hypothetical protein